MGLSNPLIGRLGVQTLGDHSKVIVLQQFSGCLVNAYVVALPS